MSVNDDKTRIKHIQEASQKVIQFTEDKSQDDFENNELLQLAIIRLIEIIGEASARLTSEFREKHPSIPWQAIIGMRNRLVHAYFAIDYDVAWATITVAIPDLLEQIEIISFDENDTGDDE